MVDYRHALAKVLHLVKLVAAEKDAATSSRLVHQDLANGVYACGVEARQRLVQDEHLWAVHERCDQLDTLLVAMGQSLHFRTAAVGDVEPFQPGACGSCSPRRAEPVEPAEVLDLLAYAHPRVKTPLLRHVTETPALCLANTCTSPPHHSSVELSEPEDGPHGRRLAGPVRAKKADYLASRHLEREVV
jgi:hypothetical protein